MSHGVERYHFYLILHRHKRDFRFGLYRISVETSHTVVNSDPANWKMFGEHMKRKICKMKEVLYILLTHFINTLLFYYY